jgi:hypothetical protein
MGKLTTSLARMLTLCAICEFTFVKKLLFLLSTLFLLVPVKAYTTTQTNFPNAQHGTILSITQYSSTDITMEVAFDNFAAYHR